MSLLPAYMDESWKSYEQMAKEDRLLIYPELINASPESCHAALLPFLAWETDSDISGLSDATARKFIRSAFDAMQYAGTARALIGPVEALSDTVDVQEWFEYGGAAYKFRIEVDASDEGLSPELIEKLERTAAKQKNVRSILENIKISMLSRGAMYHGISIQSAEVITILPYSAEFI